MKYVSFFRHGLVLVALSAVGHLSVHAQSVGVGTTTPNAAAVLDITSTAKGLLPPRMTQAQRDAMSPTTTAAGLLIYNSSTKALNSWDGGKWVEVLNTGTGAATILASTTTFGYTGGTQTYTVPASVTSIQVTAAGCASGYNQFATGSQPGAVVQATLVVVPGEVLTVVVGGRGANARSGAGGYNGGGNSASGTNGGGGGATDLRRASGSTGDYLTTRNALLVAGGAGGTGYQYAVAGAAGTPNGGNGTGLSASAGGGGATQTGPGTSGSTGNPGSNGNGGSSTYNGGGGAGYYGGGGSYTSGGGSSDGGGGGGSSWAMATGSNVSFATAASLADGSLTITVVPSLPAPAISGANITGIPGTWGVSGTNYFYNGGNVGIGTAAPTAMLDVNASTRLRGLTTAGLVTTDASGNLSSATAASLDPTTASNGLTKTANNFALGGALTAATTIAQAGYNFSLTGGNVGIGTTTPMVPLSVAPNGLGAKITLWDAGSTTQHYGFGISPNQLNYQVQGTADHVFSKGGKNNDGTEMMRLQGSTGNLGIGTAAPSALLDVNGSTRLRGLTTAGLVSTDASGNLSSATAASLDPTTASNGLTKTGNNFALGGTLTATTTIAQGGNNFSLTGGNVGIGVAAPAQALDVAGNIQASANIAVDYNNINTGTVANTLRWGGTTSGEGIGSQRSTSGGSTQYGIDFYTRSANRLTITNTGNVGIGTTAPAQALDVAGNIQASANIAVDYNNTNAGTVANILRFGPTNSGEGIGSRRTSGVNQYGIDFYTSSFNRMTVTSGGNVGIGTVSPLAGLHVDTSESNNNAALGVTASGGTTGNPSIELRGSSKTPYIDFAETAGVDYTNRIVSSGGTLNLQHTGTTTPAVEINGYTKLDGVNAGAAPAIAYAKLTATMPSGASQQVSINLPTGVTQAKVLGLTSVAGPTTSSITNLFPPNNGVVPASGGSYQLYLNNNQIVINTDGNSSSLFGQPIRILITYEQ